MEACGTAHYWGRRCQARGLVVRLLPVQYVRPDVRRRAHPVAPTRTGRINVMRGRLREQGCPVPAGARTVVRRVAASSLRSPARIPSPRAYNRSRAAASSPPPR
jgi:transposase